MTNGTRVALALGSGGARGYAHIGVIEELEARGYEITTIAGTSMGALVGGLHAAGRLDEFSAWARGLTQRDLLKLLDPAFRGPGAMKADKVLAKVAELLDGALIEELPIAYTAVATDLLAGKEVWFQEGPVAAAIRASIALPSIITPVVINGRLLADGGLMNPIPIAATLASHADLTLAVDLAGEREGGAGRTPVQESAEQRPREEWSERMRRNVSTWLESEMIRDRFPRLVARGEAWVAVDEGSGDEVDRSDEPASPAYDTMPRGIGTLEVMELSLDALQTVLSRFRVASYPPDLMVTVPKSACKVLEFHRATEVIEVGRRLAAETLDRYEAAQD